MKKLILLALIGWTFATPGYAITPDAALRKLIDGNEAYINGDFRKMTKAKAEATRARNVADGQAPYAAVLGCSDSRSPVEEIFNASVGDIFVVRTAGNTAGADQQASLEFAVSALNVPLIMVMGHTHCGAVVAAVEHTKAPGKLGKFLNSLTALVKRTDKLPEEDRVYDGTNINIEMAVAELKKNEVLAAAVKDGRLKIVGALHNIETGRVSLVD
ncbi:MAG: hypothetical protein LBB23_04885 [Rickettsiales bacterium]|jgi:carbonic anhydrase|nr:hypothetical protein [Rickettsiales bacterium]